MRRSPAAMTQEVVEVDLVPGQGRQREGSQEPAEVEPAESLNNPFSYLKWQISPFPRYFPKNYLHVFDLFHLVCRLCLLGLLQKLDVISDEGEDGGGH